MLIFYDFEVFKHDWLVVFIDPYANKKTVIVNDAAQLKAFYAANKNNIFVGYNSRHYDVYIFKSILCGYDPKKVNDFIIVDKKAGYLYSDLFNQIQLYNYDVAKINDGGLKTLEAYMGNDIEETSVDFDVDRKLTAEEIEQTITYCTYDVEQTIDVFMRRKNDFAAHMALITTFGLPLSDISKTQVRLVAKVLECKRTQYDDEFDVVLVDTLKLPKRYEHIKTRLLQMVEDSKRKNDYCDNEIVFDVAGVAHSFGWGGAHGARKQYHARGLLIHIDVDAYYPSMMIVYDLLTRNSKAPKKFKEIRDKRIALKRAGKKAEQAPYKICLNGTFGASKDITSTAYDPRQANNITINGQLLLIDLIGLLESRIDDFILVQSNTDGIIIKIPDTDEAFNAVDEMCAEWEKRTDMTLSFDIINEIWQKDVNNYVFICEDGSVERKGAYVQKNNDLKNDLTIVNDAIVAYLVDGVPVEKTIGECDDLMFFQKVVKVSNKYLCAWHNGQRLHGKTFRVFASCDPSDGGIYKQKHAGATLEKFANTPEKCVIYNGSLAGAALNIDKQFYVDLAKKRLKEFGV